MLRNRNFFRENAGLITGFVLSVLMILGLGIIYNINGEFIFYVISFLMIIWGIVLVVSFVSYRNSFKAEPVEEKDDEEEELRWQIVREKEDFFAMWAHQIKTPIAALNLLLQSKETDTGMCRQELFKIEGYVEMALNYLRFDGMSNDMVLSSVSLSSMAKQVVKKFRTVFIHKHISVQLENLDYNILTDEKWFVFVLEQIVSNAVKYTNEGSVTISAREEGRRILVEVKDTGIGIQSEDIPRLFQKGFTGYNGRMDKKASGLGLYLSKGVCNKLGHGLDVESVRGEGTKVTISVYNEKVKNSDLTKM
ncbi:MAG: sensor histidine kinase [Agathobacter sp.]|nr:sensor histidine kinase [Agathobacter sp.]